MVEQRLSLAHQEKSPGIPGTQFPAQRRKHLPGDIGNVVIPRRWPVDSRGMIPAPYTAQVASACYVHRYMKWTRKGSLTREKPLKQTEFLYECSHRASVIGRSQETAPGLFGSKKYPCHRFHLTQHGRMLLDTRYEEPGSFHFI
jgi:hypothetical protein